MTERVNSGAAWYNKDRLTEKHPSYSGTINIEGILYFIDIWPRKTEDGRTWLSMAFKKKTKQLSEDAPKAADDVPL